MAGAPAKAASSLDGHRIVIRCPAGRNSVSNRPVSGTRSHLINGCVRARLQSLRENPVVPTGLCRNPCRRYAARINFPPYPGLAPRAHCAAAAARLAWPQFRLFVPPRNSDSGCDTVSYGTRDFLAIYPALKRWAKLFRAYGAGFIGQRSSLCSAKSLQIQFSRRHFSRAVSHS